MDAATIRKRLARISGLNGGRLTPDAIVDDAKSHDSPLHEHFEWDDSVAAGKFRIDQARGLIRWVSQKITTEGKTICVPFYIRDPTASGSEQGYIETARLRTSEDVARAALRAEMISANALCDRAIALAEFFGLGSEVEHIKERISAIQARLAA